MGWHWLAVLWLVTSRLRCMQFHCLVRGWYCACICQGHDLTIITIVVCGTFDHWYHLAQFDHECGSTRDVV